MQVKQKLSTLSKEDESKEIFCQITHIQQINLAELISPKTVDTLLLYKKPNQQRQTEINVHKKIFRKGSQLQKQPYGFVLNLP